MPDSHKTIPPVNLGGVAGGQKYIVHEILFKFAFDQMGLFKGNNIAAAKVGGHELKGLMSYFSLGMKVIFLFSSFFSSFSFFSFQKFTLLDRKLISR